MWAKIVAFFAAIIQFFAALFGFGGAGGNVKTFTDLSYGSGNEQTLNLYLPEKDNANAGMIVFIHGGAWIEGDKSTEVETCKNIAKNFGYATMTMNYRMVGYPTAFNRYDYSAESTQAILDSPNSVDMLDMMDDITAALNLAVNKAAENGCTIKNTALVGYSAGAHLAMMYSYAYRDRSPVNVAFCVSYVGPADLTAEDFYFNTPEGGMEEDFVLYLGSRLSNKLVTAENFNNADVQSALQKVSPINYAANAVPTIMAYGKKDLLVPFNCSTRLDAKLTENGIRHDYFIYPNSGHGLEDKADGEANSDRFYTTYVQYCKDYFGY